MWWPFSRSSSSSSAGGEGDPNSSDVSPPTREARAKCWRSRDEFFACLDASKIASPTDKGEHCKLEAAAYETNCAKRITYFNQRRMIALRQERMLAAQASSKTS
ncbi:hypothetical protein CPB86DRAFT_778301 [Serendipita vermifera]|nr:hypothetical protein CPB86DRAFT_778301 [Serendipita vermifera]